MIVVLMLLTGAFWGLFIAPEDYQQGDSYRIIYIHVPSAFLAQSIYLMIAFSSTIFLIWRVKLADWISRACAPIGVSMTLCAIISGALWGKITWGAFWVWDARLTAMLILLLLYFAIISLRYGAHQEIAAKICAFVAIIGVINIPIIKYSVEWWFTLHQPASLKLTSRPAMAASMLWPLLWMIVAFYGLFLTVLCMRLRALLLCFEGPKKWVGQLRKL